MVHQFRSSVIMLLLLTLLTGVIYPLAVTGIAQILFPYQANSGSNLGPTNPILIEAVLARIDALRAADPGNNAPIPIDLVTASASGLDPHISPAAAEYQVPRVARIRGLDERVVLELVVQYIEGRWLGILGEPRVNVLRLNLALDALGEVE